jgi:L-ascorbate metabolism protein UlaG (beta-lactamase superfamily)
MIEKIHWLGHDSFRIDGPPTVYIDPWQLAAGAPPADLILVTHDHYDHCSPDDVRRVSKPGTVILAPATAARKLRGEVKTVKPGDKLSVASVEVQVVPAYNINKKFHPKEAGHVGYVVTIAGQRIYHTGDSDVIPEMSQIRADIMLVPVSGTYVMTAEEAVQAVAAVKPRIAIPMHYGKIVGSEEDARRLKAQAKGVEVVILKAER